MKKKIFYGTIVILFCLNSFVIIEKKLTDSSIARGNDILGEREIQLASFNKVEPKYELKQLVLDEVELEKQYNKIQKEEREKYEEQKRLARIRRMQYVESKADLGYFNKYNAINKSQYSNKVNDEQLAISLERQEQLEREIEIYKKALYSSNKKIETEQPTMPQELVDTIFNETEKLIGVPYIWGGTSPTKGMDCSGYTQYIMNRFGYNIPRVSKDQSKVGNLVSRTELLPGDLLFFDTTNPRNASDITTPTQEMQYAIQAEDGFKPTNVSHVGIYLGDGVMIHASSGDGIITYADLSSPYYKNRFLHARRILGLPKGDVK